MKTPILALLLAVTTHAQAQYFSGNKLLSMLDDTSTVAQAMAMGYVIGVADTSSERLCVPENATVRQLTDIVRRALRSVPEHRHEAADVIVIAALSASFPCKGAL